MRTEAEVRHMRDALQRFMDSAAEQMKACTQHAEAFDELAATFNSISRLVSALDWVLGGDEGAGMKISDAIHQLQEIQALKGDIPVMISVSPRKDTSPDFNDWDEAFIELGQLMSGNNCRVSVVKVSR